MLKNTYGAKIGAVTHHHRSFVSISRSIFTPTPALTCLVPIYTKYMENKTSNEYEDSVESPLVTVAAL